MNVSEITQNFVNHIESNGFHPTDPHKDPITGKTFSQRMSEDPDISGKYTYVSEILAQNLHPAGAVYEWMYNDKNWNWAHRDAILKDKDGTIFLGFGIANVNSQMVMGIDFMHPANSYIPKKGINQGSVNTLVQHGENSLLLFTNSNMNGNYCTISENIDIPKLSDLSYCSKNFNDNITSLVIPNTKCVDVFMDENFSEEKITFCGRLLTAKPLRINLLNKPVDKLLYFNDKISSLKFYSGDIYNQNKIFFYVDTNGEGYSSAINVGTNISDVRDRKILSVGNGNISSFNLPADVCLELYQHIDYQGIMRKFCNSSNTKDVVSFGAGQFENDQLSSLKSYFITQKPISSNKKVKFFEHGNETGASFEVVANCSLSDARDASFPIGNDKVSAFKIAPRVCLDIYQDINYNG